LGSSLNAIVSPSLAKLYESESNYNNVGIPLLIGLVFMIASLLLAFVLCYFDLKT
jgi:hypothetical protein